MRAAALRFSADFPDFAKNDFYDAIVEFNRRNRRFGGNASWKKEYLVQY